MAAGAQAWQMPNQVGMQRPVSAPVRLAQASPSWLSHSLLSVHALELLRESMPWWRLTASVMFSTPKASPYFSEGLGLSPSQR